MIASQAQQHPWFKRLLGPIPYNLSPMIVENMQRFQFYNVLKKAALTAVAYHLDNVW